VMYLTVVLGLLLVAQQVGAQVQPGPPLTIGDLLAQDVPLLVLCFVGVGIFVRRSPRQTVERLGLLSPRQKRWWLVAVLGIAVFHPQYAVSVASLEVFTLGLGLGWLRVRAGSILPGMVTHAGYDIAVGFLSLIAK